MLKMSLQEPEVKIEKPEKLTAKNVCYWMESEGILLGDMKSKAKKFIKNGCVKKAIRDNVFIVKPLEGYNITTHLVDNEICSCQWRQKHNLECSHEMAVKIFKFLENWNK